MTRSALLLLTPLLCLPACGGDDDAPTDSSGGSGNQSGGSGGSGGPGAGGSGATSGSCDLSGDGKERVDAPTDIDADTTWTSDKVWVLGDKIYVNSGATLTIEPCTRIEGGNSPIGVLLITRGAKLNAVGTADEPILFTSRLPVGARAAGNWGGVVLLGNAPNFESGELDPVIEGLPIEDPRNRHGGDDPADSSGQLSYVRIEYSGFELSADNEINGLTMGSVGSGTKLDHIMVSNTVDDCFEWFGGRADASYLIANNCGDDMFDVDTGYQGNLQFLFGRHVQVISSNPNGFECDSSNSGLSPVTTPNISNATLCGSGKQEDAQTFGAVLREQIAGTFNNVLLTGFQFGVDVRDVSCEDPNVPADCTPESGNPAKVNMTGSVLFGNFEQNVSGEVDDDDFGFDEDVWFAAAERGNSTADPMLGDCLATPPAPFPASEVTGNAPTAPNDTSATYVGAFRDADDNWMTGLWVDWAEN